MLFPAADGAAGLEQALDDLFDAGLRGDRAGAEPHHPLRPRRRRRDRADPVAAGLRGLHHHLVREGCGPAPGWCIESGDAREVHHFALLIGYGAGAINPYLAFETLDDMIRQGLLSRASTTHEAVKKYRKAIKKGVVKVMSKMGISTIQSYRGAQIFEAIGLNEEFVDKYFDRTAVADRRRSAWRRSPQETLHHHHRAYADREVGPAMLDEGGQYQWRRDGEYHLFNPETVFRLQHATQAGRYDIFKKYTKLVDDQNERLCTLRGLFDFKLDGRQPVPIEEVEPVEAIVKRFATGAMSLRLDQRPRRTRPWPSP